MSLDPPPSRPRREPVFNAPAVVVATIAVLVVIHVVRLFLPDDINLILVLDLAFVPARLSVALDPDRMAVILTEASDTFAGLNADEKLEFARYVIGDGDAKIWTLITHALLHGSWLHLVFNSLWLLAFGSPVARRFGTGRFLAFFVICAVAGAGAHYITHADDIVPMIGASGAISGLMAAATRFAFRRNLPFAVMRTDPTVADRGPAMSVREIARDRRVMMFVLIWFGTNLLFGLASTPLGLTDGTIAWEAHVGGFIAGFLLFPWIDPVGRAFARRV